MVPLNIEEDPVSATHEFEELGRRLDDIKSNASTGSLVGDICLSIFLFILAGVAEIGGGYLVWKGIREKFRPALTITLGSLTLIAYGFIPTLQPLNNFGRIFAVYGGFFIVLSYLWGYYVDGAKVDIGDIIGSLIALAGVGVCWFWPRGEQ